MVCHHIAPAWPHLELPGPHVQQQGRAKAGRLGRHLRAALQYRQRPPRVVRRNHLWGVVMAQRRVRPVVHA